MAMRGISKLQDGLGVARFSGPPGVRKTHAMKLLACEAGLKALVISACKLVNDFDACQHATKCIQQNDGIF